MKTLNYIKTYYKLFFTEWKWIILGVVALPIFALLLLDGILYDITHPHIIFSRKLKHNKMKKFNINNDIYIQINDSGWKHLRERVNDDYIKHCIESHRVEINGETWYKLQCHSVFDLFPINYAGETLINTNIMFDDKIFS